MLHLHPIGYTSNRKVMPAMCEVFEENLYQAYYFINSSIFSFSLLSIKLLTDSITLSPASGLRT